jgi:hypothetical protein
MPLSTGLAGDPVRCYTLAGATDRGQVVAIGQPKDAYAPYARTGITSRDGPSSGTYDPATLTPFDARDAVSVWISGACDTPAASIGLVIAYYEASTGLWGISRGFSLQSSTYYRTGSLYLAVPAWEDLYAASQFAIVVTDVTAGSTWSLLAKLV